MRRAQSCQKDERGKVCIWKHTIAKVSVANSTLTKPLANRISTICERWYTVSTIPGGWWVGVYDWRQKGGPLLQSEADRRDALQFP